MAITDELAIKFPKTPGYAYLNGEWWFIASDICDMLGLPRGYEATINLPLDCVRSYPRMEHNLVNQVGIYFLALKGKNQLARNFQTWVMSEVLPSIACHDWYIHADYLAKKTHWHECKDLTDAERASKTPKDQHDLHSFDEREARDKKQKQAEEQAPETVEAADWWTKVRAMFSLNK